MDRPYRLVIPREGIAVDLPNREAANAEIRRRWPDAYVVDHAINARPKADIWETWDDYDDGVTPAVALLFRDP